VNFVSCFKKLNHSLRIQSACQKSNSNKKKGCSIVIKEYYGLVFLGLFGVCPPKVGWKSIANLKEWNSVSFS